MTTPPKPAPEETAFWQKRLASQANNRAWALADQLSRTPDEDEEMLQAAHAAMFFWKIIGTPKNHAHAAQLLAHVYALGHLPKPASFYLDKSNAFFQVAQNEPWEIAFTLLVNANVAHAACKFTEHRHFYEQAQTTIANLADPEDQNILQISFASVPKPVSGEAP